MALIRDDLEEATPEELLAALKELARECGRRGRSVSEAVGRMLLKEEDEDQDIGEFVANLVEVFGEDGSL